MKHDDKNLNWRDFSKNSNTTFDIIRQNREL